MSRRKDGKKFRLNIFIDLPNEKCSVFTDPILVLSKRKYDKNYVDNNNCNNNNNNQEQKIDIYYNILDSINKLQDSVNNIVFIIIIL